jgi:hypothetical protein
VRTRYLLPCACGERIPIEAIQAGEIVRCDCGADVEVPSMQVVTALEEAPPEPIPERGFAAPWDTRRARVFLGLAVCVGGLALGGYFHATRPKLTGIESLTPLQTWRLWQELRAGPDHRPSPEARYLVEAIRANRRWIGIALTMAALGLALAISSLLLRRRPRRAPPTSSRRKRRIAASRTG